MNRHLALVLPILVIIGIGLVVFDRSPSSQPAPEAAAAAAQPAPASSYLDATYTIDGMPVTLTDGSSTVPAAPGSAEMVTTSEFDSTEVAGDLNGDGVGDIGLILAQTGAGSGTFYYAVVALASSTGTYTGTNAILLGDRIAPQSMQITGGQFVVNYADRAPGEPMTTAPSVGVSKYLQIENGQLVEVPGAAQ